MVIDVGTSPAETRGAIRERCTLLDLCTWQTFVFSAHICAGKYSGLRAPHEREFYYFSPPSFLRTPSTCPSDRDSKARVINFVPRNPTRGVTSNFARGEPPQLRGNNMALINRLQRLSSIVHHEHAQRIIACNEAAAITEMRARSRHRRIHGGIAVFRDFRERKINNFADQSRKVTSLISSLISVWNLTTAEEDRHDVRMISSRITRGCISSR